MPDYMFLLESRLSPEQRAALLRVQELSATANVNVYLAGGAVRDLISGMPIRDLDFVLEGTPFRLARELEKGGARVLSEDERLRHVELIFAGDVDGSLAAARDDVYARPGTKPDIHWSTVMEDLRRRDFSLNAIAISLNPASRGLLLDPTNGLADLEKHEVRGLSIHTFTNQPVRLLRLYRYCARMGFKPESRTAEWAALAIERGLHDMISPDDVGREVRQLGREEKPTAILKAWEDHGLIGAIHAQLARRHPHYEMLHRMVRVRDDMVAAGLRPRLFAPATLALLGRLKPREQSAALHRLEFRTAEVDSVLHLDQEARKLVKVLAGRKTAAPRDAFGFLEKAPLNLLVYILAEVSNAKVVGKIRNFLHKWRPLRLALPNVAVELEALGLPHGPKFDKVLEEFFQQQLLGKGRNPEDRTRLLRRLAGIKEPPKKKVKEEKKKVATKAAEKPGKKAPGTPGPRPGAEQPPSPEPPNEGRSRLKRAVRGAGGGQVVAPAAPAKTAAAAGKTRTKAPVPKSGRPHSKPGTSHAGNKPGKKPVRSKRR